MKTKLRKLLALLMTLAMFISSVPTTALAAVVPYPGGTDTGSGISLRSIVKPPVATTTYVFMNGTEEFARQILKNGQTLNNPGTPTADSANKEFVGWFDESGNQLTFPITASVGSASSTVTVNAQFADVYFVFFTNEKGEVMVTKKGANGDTISTEGVTYPVGNEQSIVGWKDASGNLVSSVTLNGSDVTLTARVENGHWITYDSQGGTYVAPAFVKGNGTTTAPAAPTRPGYTFRHWSASVGGAAFTFGQPLDQALTLYAVWTANTNTRYTVIHWLENADDNEYSYRESETKTGATGAQTNAAAKSYTGFTAQTIAQQTIAGDGSTIVNVYYKRNVYNVQFYERKSNRWQEIPNLKITAKYQAFIGDKWPTYNGSSTWSTTSNYSWSSGLQGPYQVNIETMPLNGAKFYGPKTGSSSESAHYYVEVLPGESGVTTIDSVTYKLHHTDTSPGTGYTVTVEDQYPITGFTFNSSPSTQIGGRYNDAKFYYTRNSYNVVYVSGGQTVNTASKKFEESIADAGSYTPNTKPAGMEDYVFGGWHADPAGEQAYTFNGKTMPAQNVTVYAKWNKPVYNGTIYLTIEGTTGSSFTLSVPKGDTIETALNEKQAEIMAQVGEGYTWRGWRTGKDGTGEPFNPETQITTDVTLYPYYTKDGTFKVEYDAVKNDVTAPEDGKSYAEDSFADLMSPGKLVAADGEYFLGWSDGAATYQPRDKYQIKSNHADERNVITLTAQWGARPAGTTLTYKANGGTGADVVENLANNETVTTIANPFSRVGYTFKGWDTNPKGEGSIAPNTQVQVDNNGGENVLYAIWTANTNTKYTVEFYYQNVDGTYTLNHSDERTATTDTEVSVTDADKAAKENNKYVFEADNKNNVLSGNVAGDGSLVLKLYFKLNTASYTIHHYLNGTTVKVADDQTGTKTIGETLTANRSDALYAAYAAAGVASYAPSQTITIAADESENVITVYYTMPLTIKAKDASKTYDGQPLTQPDFTVEGLVNGDTKENFTLSMTAESTITNAGSTPNVIDKDTVKYNGGAIPSYYNVSYANGTLTVNKASATVTITGVNETAVYDGTQHEANGYNYSFAGESNEITISLKPNVLAIAKRTDVGTTYMGLTKDSFTVTSANYDVTINEVIDGYVTITPVTDKVTVTVTENGAIVTYDGNEHSVKGYKSMTANNELYDVTTSVKATETAAWTAKGTDAGEYPVGIAAGDFENTNKNFTNVTFKVVDDVLKINPVTDEVIVTVTENGATVTYDGTEHSVKGYKSMTADNALYDVTKSVKATETAAWTAKGTDAGEYPVGIAAGDFENTNKNFTNVTFKVVDDVLKINPVADEVIVTVTENGATVTYDGTEHSVKGYKSMTANNELYDVTTSVKATETAAWTAKGTDAGEYPVGIAAGDFENTNKNFTNVTFKVVDDVLKINPVTDEVIVTVTENGATVTYDGTEHSVKGYKSMTADNALYDVTKSVKATETAAWTAKGTDAGEYPVGIAAGDFENTNKNFTNVTFKVVDDVLKINPVTDEVIVTVTENGATVTYDGTEHSVKGYKSMTADNALYDVTKSVKATETAAWTAKGTDAGEYPVGIAAGDFENTNKNFTNVTFKVVDDVLKINPVTDEVIVTVTENGATVTYDGTEHSVKGYKSMTADNALYDVTKSVKATETAAWTAKGTDAGEYPVGIAAGDFENTNKNFTNVTFKVVDDVLKINPVTDEVIVTVTENGATVTYDGTEHSVKGYKSMTADNALYDVTKSVKATETAAWTAKGTDAGEYPVGIAAGDFENTNKNFTNVTFNIVDGVLKINPITENTITITANSASKIYDGTPLTDNGFTFTQGVLADGDELTAVVEGSATNVGDEGRNVVKSYKVKRGETDVTKNYTFGNSIDGKLTINKRTVTLKSETASKEYDGTPLTKPDVTVTGDGFVTGEVTDVKATGSVTFVHEGEVTNAITYTEGANFKETNYTISKEEGKLSITKREGEGKTITVTANSDEKVYDGAPLTNNGFTHAGALVEGDVLTAVVEGSQTDVGSSDNVVTSYVVMRGETDVTTSYTFTESGKGALTVTLRGVTFTGESKSLPYTGGMQSITGITQSGLVEGHRYEGLTYKAEGQNVGSYDGAFSGDVVIKDAQGNDVTKNYNVTKTPGKLTITNASFIVTFTGESDTKVYNGSEQSITGITVVGLKTGHRYENLTYAAKGTDKGEYVGAFTGTVKILDENNVDVTENYAITQTPGKLTITAVETEVIVKIRGTKDTVEYDGQKHEVNGYEVVSISNTLYTEADFGFADGATAHAEGTDAGDYFMNLTKDSFVNRNANFSAVTFVVEDGKLTITKRGLDKENLVKIIAANNTVYYDGQPHGAKLNAAGQIEVGTSYTTEYLALGHKVQTVAIDGSETMVGVYEGRLVPNAAIIVDENDNDVTRNYVITYVPGTLEIRKNETEIKVTANSHTWEYDGQPHSDGGYTVEYDGQTYKVEAGETATLPTGDVVKAKITKTVTNVSDSAANNNQIDELTIVNAAGEDTKGQYKTVTLIPGTLTITKRGAGEDKVKITAADNTVEYDGRPHGAKLNAAGQIEVGTSYTVTNLAEGHNVKTLAIEGSETDAGVYADKLVPGNAVIVDGSGVEVTANYDITYVPGALTITRRGAGDDKVVLTAANNTVVYDGQPHGVKLNAAGEIEVGTSYTITNLANGHKVQSVVISGSETAVGEYENRLVPSGAKIVDAEGNDVTRNYVVGYKNGKLTITSPDTVIVTIRGNKDTVEYDGQKHEVNGYEVVSISNTLYTEADFGFADGATAHAEGTDAGDYFMNLTKDSFVNRNANFSAVTFVVEDGKLTITKRGLDKENLVKIIAANNTVYYDGQPHGAKLNAAGQIEVGTSYTTEYLALGHKVQTVAIDGSETMVGVYEGRLVPNAAIIVDENDNDVTRNYVITYVPGTLEIRKNETEIKVTANSHTWEYDGQPHSDGGYTVNYDGVDYPVAAGEFATLPTGDKVTATVEGSVTNVADSADDNNVVTNVTITNEAGVVVNDQYKTITRVNGGLKITRRGDSEDEDKKVRIIAEPNTVEYDGKAHGAKLNAKGEIELGTSYTTARLVDGHYVDETTLDITGSQTNVGVYAEELKPAVKAGATRIVIRDKDDNDVTDNYALTLVNATLTITGDKLIPDKKAEDENIESNYKLGDKIEFTITVKNVSIYEVENVEVVDRNAEIQAGDGYTVSADKHTATIASIAAKSEIRIKALHTVTSEDILAGKVGNVANVEWKDGEKTVTKTVDDDTTKLTPPDVTLNVTKTSDWEGSNDKKVPPEVGTKITYTITVTNTGNVPATNVRFKDVLQENKATVTGDIPTYGTLGVGEENKESFTVEYIVTEADLLKGSILNEVFANADEINYTYYVEEDGKEVAKPGTKTVKEAEAFVEDTTVQASASFTSTKTTTSTPKNEKGYALGETITYEIKVTNDGNLTLTDVEVTEKLAGAVIKASSDYTVSGSVATIAELKPGQTVIVNVEYVVTEADILAGSVKNVATVKGNGPDDKDPDPKDPGTDDPTDKPKATLDIAKSVVSTPKNGTSYKLGEKITYKLTVKVGADNNVTVKDVRVTDTLLTAENVNAKIVEIAGGYTLNATGEVELPDMAPGAADVVITYTYTVQESDLGSGAYGSVHNAAVSKGATPDPDPENPNPKPDDPKDEDKKDTPTNIRLVIMANNNTGIVYDGEEHGEDGYKQTGLSKDHTIEKVTISGKRTNVGEEKLVPSDAKIVDKAGNDVTSHYDIEYVNATLEIIQKKLTITADSDEKFYDETPLTKDSYTNTELAKGDKIANVTITGTITEVGSVENVASGAKIVNAAGEDVTGNYDIEYVKGTLTIKAIPADGFVDVTITKKWDDANNQDGKRDDVTLTLNASANGRLIDWDVLKDIAKNGANLTMDETAEHVFARAEFTDDKDSYSYTFRNVPKYANFNDVNTLIDFAVTENEVPDFYEIDVENSTRLMIVNVHEVKTMNIHVTKVWDDEDNNDGYRPDAITVKLYADGALYGEKTITPDENDVWETTFENLPVYKKGETISYSVEEDAIDEYTTTYSTEKPIVGGDYDEAAREVTITNRYEIKKMNIKVIKIWADSDNEDKLRPNALSFDLYKTVGGGERELVLQFQLRSSTGTSVWKYKDLRTTIGGLNVYENGEKIHYSIEETTVIEGYTVKYIDNDIVGGNKVNDQYQTDFMTWVTNYHIIKRPNRLIGPMGMTSGECVE